MDWLNTLDTSLFRSINQSLSNPVFDHLMPWLSGNPLFLPLAITVGAFLIWRDRTRGILCVLMIGLAVAIGDGLICKKIKRIVERPRPFVTLSDARTPSKDRTTFVAQANGNVALIGSPPPVRKYFNSLPSAHATNWFAATMVMFLFYRGRSLSLMLPVALLVSFSRVYNGQHYPADVFLGAILGAGTGAAVVIALVAGWKLIGRKWFPAWHERTPDLLKASPPVPTPEATTEKNLDRHWLRAGYTLIVALMVFRWFYISSDTIGLSEDEAYQWLWSKHLAPSYFSKPLMIALTQFLGTSLWGDTAFGVRFFSPVIAAGISFMLLRFFVREVNARAGFFLILILTSTPLLAAGATLMTVDPLSVLFWTAAMIAGWRAIKPEAGVVAWLWVGLWMGLGFLSKYTALFQWLCWAIFLLLWPPARKHLRTPGPYLALAVNCVLSLPVLIWNHQHGWPTVAHVIRDNAGLDKPWQPTLRYFFEFIGGEFALLNPVYFVGIIAASILFWRRYRDDVRLIYLFAMGAPVFLVYLLFTFHSRVFLNWISPAVVPLLCLTVIYWDRRFSEGRLIVKHWFVSGLVIGLAFITIMHDTNLVDQITGRALPPKLDPSTRVRAWRSLAAKVGEARNKLQAEGPPVFIIGHHYGITSLVAFYLPEAREHVETDTFVYCRTTDRPRNQFYFWPGYQNHREGQNAIFVKELKAPKLKSGWFIKWLAGEDDDLTGEAQAEPPPAWLLEEFDSVNDLGVHKILYRGRVFHTIQMFECRNLR